ncbi:MAG TPA: hypothetical protein VI365_05320 [Trebonia sp.]
MTLSHEIFDPERLATEAQRDPATPASASPDPRKLPYTWPRPAGAWPVTGNRGEGDDAAVFG